MNSFFKKISNAVSAVLPFDGSKTTIGAWLAGTGILAHVIPGLNIAALVQYLIANPTQNGFVLMLIGLAHKVLKEKFPTSPDL